MPSEGFLYTREKYKAVPEEEHVLKPPLLFQFAAFRDGARGGRGGK